MLQNELAWDALDPKLVECKLVQIAVTTYKMRHQSQ